MSLIPEALQPRFETGSGGVTVRGMAAPSRRAKELVMYCVRMAPGAALGPHRHDHEEVFLVTTGSVTSRQDGVDVLADSGDVVVVPPGLLHSATAGTSGATLVVAMPSGATTTPPGGHPTVAPWSR